MKKILGIHSAARPHWVGDGFPVRSLFSYNSHGEQISPFLLCGAAWECDGVRVLLGLAGSSIVN